MSSPTPTTTTVVDRVYACKLVTTYAFPICTGHSDDMVSVRYTVSVYNQLTQAQTREGVHLHEAGQEELVVPLHELESLLQACYPLQALPPLPSYIITNPSLCCYITKGPLHTLVGGDAFADGRALLALKKGGLDYYLGTLHWTLSQTLLHFLKCDIRNQMHGITTQDDDGISQEEHKKDDAASSSSSSSGSSSGGGGDDTPTNALWNAGGCKKKKMCFGRVDENGGVLDAEDDNLMCDEDPTNLVAPSSSSSSSASVSGVKMFKRLEILSHRVMEHRTFSCQTCSRAFESPLVLPFASPTHSEYDLSTLFSSPSDFSSSDDSNATSTRVALSLFD